MEETRQFNFEIIFEKIEEFKKENSYIQCIDNQLLKQVDKDIESIKRYLEEINESQYFTYSRS